ncbi:MAG: serine protease [Pseudomonadota bacterium]
MARVLLTLIVGLFAGVMPAQAQQTFFVQIEAQPTIARAQASIERFLPNVRDLNGFDLGNGWFGIALGPYAEDQAASILSNLRSARLIPSDSYVQASSRYRRQFWPVGANLLGSGTTIVTTETDTQTAALAPQSAEETPQPSDETPSQARASEARLNQQERAAIQEALQWAGFYNGKIDASFGRGTRASMSRWQESNGFVASGVLTTRQRAELFRQFNAVLEGLDLRQSEDVQAGISVKLPLGVLDFDRYDPPFAHYEPTGTLDARVLLISQPGNSGTLRGLYEVMQTLAIVPSEGERSISSNGFTLFGQDANITSFTQASLEDGQIKGFSLIWPSGDEERRTRLLGDMRASFVRLDGVLDSELNAEGTQSIDFISGLAIRKPIKSSSGFYVDTKGTVVTSADAISGCNRVTIDEAHEADILLSDLANNIAVLTPVKPLSPLGVATFQTRVPRLNSEIAVSGFSYGGVLGAPTLTFGSLADTRGLHGETSFHRLALSALDGDAGGPVVDAAGAVVGMLLPAESDGRQLPEGVGFSLNSETISLVLGELGVSIETSETRNAIPSERLNDRASGFTVLVSCWG